MSKAFSTIRVIGNACLRQPHPGAPAETMSTGDSNPQDLTPLSRINEPSFASEAELRALAELAPIGIFKQDANGCIDLYEPSLANAVWT